MVDIFIDFVRGAHHLCWDRRIKNVTGVTALLCRRQTINRPYFVYLFELKQVVGRLLSMSRKHNFESYAGRARCFYLILLRNIPSSFALPNVHSIEYSRSYKLGSLQATLSIKGLIGPDLYVSDTQYGRPKVRWEIAAIADERIIDGAW